MINGTKIITSVYELLYENDRGGGIYKSFQLLTYTIQNIIFPEYQYIIYTDKQTYDKYLMGDLFDKPNVTIKIAELNSDYYLEKINPVREFGFNHGEIYERIYCVKNYAEVMLNKLKFLLNESADGSSVIWIDSGLMGTCCHDGWRDYMAPLVNSKNFLDKLVTKINQHGFIHLRSNLSGVNYEIVNRFRDLYGFELKIVPGGLFGGKSDSIRKIFNGYLEVYTSYIDKYNQIVTDQELLAALINKHPDECYAFEFDDWLDLQKGLLQILDMYDESRYVREKCYV